MGKRCRAVADCIIPMSCEGAGRTYLVMLVCLKEGMEGTSDDELLAQMCVAGRAAGIQRFEYPLAFVRVEAPFTKDNGFRNTNGKPLRKKIDEHWKAQIDELYSKSAPSD